MWFHLIQNSPVLLSLSLSFRVFCNISLFIVCRFLACNQSVCFIEVLSKGLLFRVFFITLRRTSPSGPVNSLWAAF